MTENTERKRVVAALTATAEVFGKNLSPTLLKIYCGDLGEYTASQVERALTTYRKTGEPFMPKPSDIVKLIDGTSSDHALAAWTKALTTVQAHGGYESVVFDDPLIHACIENMGGWQEFCKLEVSETPFRAAEFQKRYAAFQRRPPATYLRKMIGRHESDNTEKGFTEAVRAPVAIGDKGKCRDVLRNGVAFRAGAVRLADAVERIGKPTVEGAIASAALQGKGGAA